MLGTDLQKHVEVSLINSRLMCWFSQKHQRDEVVSASLLLFSQYGSFILVYGPH